MIEIVKSTLDKLTFIFIPSGLIVVILQGCFLIPVIGPGYWVSIYINDPNFKRENMVQFEEIAIREKFEKTQTVDENERYGEHYHKNQSEKSMLTQIIISYSHREHLLEVEILNIWEGQQLRTEIDRIADIYIDTLSNVYGQEKLKIVRRRTGPGI